MAPPTIKTALASAGSAALAAVATALAMQPAAPPPAPPIPVYTAPLGTPVNFIAYAMSDPSDPCRRYGTIVLEPVVRFYPDLSPEVCELGIARVVREIVLADPCDPRVPPAPIPVSTLAPGFKWFGMELTWLQFNAIAIMSNKPAPPVTNRVIQDRYLFTAGESGGLDVRPVEGARQQWDVKRPE